MTYCEGTYSGRNQTMSDPTCDECDGVAAWTWHDGMWSKGRYCDEHIREKLTERWRFVEYRDEITTADTVTTIGNRETVVIPAGAKPIGQTYPVIRTKEALDEYRDSSDAGPDPATAPEEGQP